MRKATMWKSGSALRTACVVMATVSACAVPLLAAAQHKSAAPEVRAELGRLERYLDDSVLTARVKLALLDAPDVSAMDIGVRTHRGVVQLSGFVDGARLVRRAEEIAARVPGVVEVRNTLQVKG